MSVHDTKTSTTTGLAHTIKTKIVGLLLIAAVAALGAALGHFVLAGGAPAPSNATTPTNGPQQPQQDTQERQAPQVCTYCITTNGSGGGGNVPGPLTTGNGTVGNHR